MGLFGKPKTGPGSGVHAAVRVSRGWAQTLEFLKARESLRVLDFGATSPANINFLTQLGHSVYMANVVEDAAKPEYQRTVDGKSEFDAEAFAAACFDFSGKEFDAVLLWDTADFLPPAAVPALFAKLRAVLHAEGRLLAFFHGKGAEKDAVFSRYHITDGSDLVLQPVGGFSVQKSYQTREIENFLAEYSDVRFLLGKDNVREVIAVR